MKPALPHICVVIPAYNESGKIGEVLAAFARTPYRVIVVNDGSGDATACIARSYAVQVVEHPYNLGQGAAIQTGIHHALTLRPDAIVTFDADGQHFVRDIETVIAPILAGKADAVFGNRFLGEAIHMPRLRRLCVHGLSVVFNVFFGLTLSDANCGVRGFSPKAAESITITHNRMSHTLDIIRQVKKHRLAYAQVPVTLIYTSYSLHKGQALAGMLRIGWDFALGGFRRLSALHQTHAARAHALAMAQGGMPACQEVRND